MAYTYEGMTKISFQEALERFRDNEEVYLLYDDETEALAESEAGIMLHHSYEGEFGHE